LSDGELKIEKSASILPVRHEVSSNVNAPTPDPVSADYKQGPFASPNATFLSAKSNLMDVTGYSLDSPRLPKSTAKNNDLKKITSANGNHTGQGHQPLVSDQNPPNKQFMQHSLERKQSETPSNLETQSVAKANERSDPAMPTSATTPQSTPKEERKRPKSPPATAPPVMMGNKKKPEQPKTPAPSSGSGLGGLKSWIIKKFNPDATECHLPENEEQPYYDKERKRWIFPGDDPDEVSKPLAPPPTITPKANEESAAIATPKENTPKDPLAAMMAPPSRVPSAMKRSATVSKSTPSQYPPGMMVPPGAGGPGGMLSPPAISGGAAAPPQFAVFTPKPTKEPKK